ncbi:sugar phosphate nucleotidyltransferase [Nocardia noduli]|uniref:sugar phosphate nucleotidyltransferase n=1 Tax=Nocardia noduli TaxID=2815722 RepID=UPI001C232AA9|nr:sugar phosphate nucleotidyltransferase [Nocardia noduli]
MKGLIFASGGADAELRPLVASMPKYLIPIANQPMLIHILRQVRDMGVTEVGIVAGEFASRIADEIGDPARLGLSITYILQSAPLGLAQGVRSARDFLRDDDFVVYRGDCLLGNGIVDTALEFQERRPAAQVVVAKVIDPTGFGVVRIGDDGSVTELDGKPEQARDDIVLTGVYFFTSTIHGAVDSIPHDAEERYLADAVQWLLDRDFPVVASQFDGPYIDMGDVLDVLECNQKVLEDLRSSVAGQVDGFSELIGSVVVEKGASIVRSRIEGPVVIGAGTAVQDSDIGPHTSIGRHCEVRSSEITYSILMDRSSVSAVRNMRSSIIGRAASVSGVAERGRVLISDHCRVEAM